jgi:hypothetical protein
MNDQEWNSLRRVLTEERAVSRTVAEARPYVRYEQGDPDGVVYADGRWAKVPGNQRGPVFTLAVNLTGGLIITKHPVPGAVPVLPQMRPDRPVRVHLSLKGKKGHLHSEMKSTARAAHVSGKAHEGEDPDALHSHVEDGLAKYLLTPKPIVEWDKKHAHSPGGPTENHWHFDHKDGQLTCETGVLHVHRRRGKDTRLSPEKRLDMNPLAEEKLADARRVFFSIEGSIKADALLSRDECAFAVPSVTMWSAPELGDFAREHLAGKEVYVVPDRDWATNPLVAMQAFLCADYLKKHGVRKAAVAASPGPEKGIDDFLAAGGTVAEMVVKDRYLPSTFHRWEQDVMEDRSIGGEPARRGIVETVRLLAMLANEHGVVAKPGRDLLRYAGFSPKRLEAALRRLQGDILMLAEGGEPPVFMLGTWEVDARWWEQTPVFLVRKDLRAVEGPPRNLGAPKKGRIER